MLTPPPPIPGAAVLITRPEPGAVETATACVALGWTPILAPPLLLRPCPPAGLPSAQALLLTSRAAARALRPLALPVLAVGEGTATEARAQGFADVRAAAGDAAALARQAAECLDPAAGPLLLAVGRGYGAELASSLRQHGFRVIRRVVYAAEPATDLPKAAQAALAQGQVSAALFTSPRGARITLALLHRAGLTGAVRGIRALALSPRIAEALAVLPWARVETTPQPDPALLPQCLGPPPA